MGQNQNQFEQSPEKGMMDLRFNWNVISCRVDSALAATVPAGEAVAVKLVDNGSKIPTVTPITADTDDVFGFVKYNYTRNSLKAGDVIDVAAMDNNVMYMQASAAIAKGAALMPVVTGVKVATAVGTGKTIVGYALDKATAADQLIRVRIKLPSGKVA